MLKLGENKINAIAGHYSEIMKLLGMPITVSTQDTPKRVAKMLVNEVCYALQPSAVLDLQAAMKVFPNDNGQNMVIIRNVRFTCFCEHHMLPFSGAMNIGYTPNNSIVGLSKIPRIVEFLSKKPNLQENLVKEVAMFLKKTVDPHCVYVAAQATHTCVACRGIKSDCKTITKYVWTCDEENHYGYEDFKTLGGFDFAV